mmetsp:Transcript_21705/g.56341  ORF Transcript_21705/g.56341 Transcript_21705/m.56341 type:complete len:198 (-) Transcript_21705:468-1061(-)
MWRRVIAVVSAGVGVPAAAVALDRAFERSKEGGDVLESDFNPFPVEKVEAKGGKELVASFGASGIIFKDTAEVTAFDDPDVEGVTVYISNMKDGRLKPKFWFQDPSSSSISVVQTGPIKFRSYIEEGVHGEDIFKESRNLFFKTVRVRRVYDESRNTLVYVGYSTRFASNDNDQKKSDQYKTSVSVIPLGAIRPPHQ